MEEATALVGKVLSERYRLDAVLGEGADGSVFTGTHLKLGREVAVKVLRSAGSDAVTLDRFFQEARAAASVDSPGVVDVVDLEVDESVGPYIVMEKLCGNPLTDELRRGPLTPEDSAALIGELLDVLAAVHAHDIVHRDLKPPNVFLHHDEAGKRVVKVLDFGIAKVRQSHLTLTGEIVGTPRFMSPEQARGEPLDHRTDLYAAGLLLYCCLSGQAPYADLPANRVLAHVADGPEPLRQIAPGLPQSLYAVVERALALQPADRYASAELMAADLRAALVQGSQGTLETPATDDIDHPSTSVPKTRGWRPLPLVVLAVALLLLVAALGTGVFVWRHTQTDEQPP